jgi:ATP-dependent DNA helicase RecQ
MLRDLRKVAKKAGVPPFVVFSRSIFRRYGIKISYNFKCNNVHGVGEGKAKKYGKNLSNYFQLCRRKRNYATR